MATFSRGKAGTTFFDLFASKDSIMDGDLQELIDSLIAADQAAKLAKMNEN